MYGQIHSLCLPHVALNFQLEYLVFNLNFILRMCLFSLGTNMNELAVSKMQEATEKKYKRLPDFQRAITYWLCNDTSEVWMLCLGLSY